MVRPRWDIDEWGRGVADAEHLLPDANTLLRLMGEPEWVTEQPEAHLLPHTPHGHTVRLRVSAG